MASTNTAMASSLLDAPDPNEAVIEVMWKGEKLLVPKKAADSMSCASTTTKHVCENANS